MTITFESTANGGIYSRSFYITERMTQIFQSLTTIDIVKSREYRKSLEEYDKNDLYGDDHVYLRPEYVKFVCNLLPETLSVEYSHLYLEYLEIKEAQTRGSNVAKKVGII